MSAPSAERLGRIPSVSVMRGAITWARSLTIIYVIRPAVNVLLNVFAVALTVFHVSLVLVSVAHRHFTTPSRPRLPATSSMASSLPPFVQACSGALGSATANAVSYPLDLVATRVQTSTSRRARGPRGTLRVLSHAVKTEGFAGLYDGLGADTASQLISNFLYFYFYTSMHALAARQRKSPGQPLLEALRRALTSPSPATLLSLPTELAVGFAAGVASRAISTPLSLVAVRLQAGDPSSDASDAEDDASAEKRAASPSPSPQKRTFAAVAREIYATHGLAGFWAGFRATLPLCVTPALTLLLFQLFSRVRVRGRPALGAFLGGACANALAQTLLYPLLLAKVHMQAGDGNGGGLTGVWRAAVRREGYAGLYHGWWAQIVKGFVAQGVTMLVKQRIERGVVRAYMRGRQ